MGIPFRIIKPDAEELDAEVYDPSELVLHNARLKSEIVRKEFPQSCIFASDTTVALGNQIFNKPKDLFHAAEMLRSLSGKTHSVFTAVVFCHGDHFWEFVEESQVTFKVLTDEAIQEYIDIVHCLDKAGSYAIQEERERVIDGYSGSFHNIMGFPVESIRQRLRESGYLE